MRRRLICFCVLSIDWKPAIQPKIDKTEKQFFELKSQYYFLIRTGYFVELLCYASYWTFNWPHPDNYWSFLLCALTKAYENDFDRKNSGRIVIIKYLEGLCVWESGANVLTWITGYNLQGLSWMTWWTGK